MTETLAAPTGTAPMKADRPAFGQTNTKMIVLLPQNG
jgi:hypothetical protein